MAKKKPKKPHKAGIHPTILKEGKECIEDAKAIYVYSTDHDWSLPQLAEEFKGVKNCSEQSLRDKCAREFWVELRTRFRNSINGAENKELRDLAKKKKSDQGLLNVNRIERLIELLMVRFSNSEQMIIPKDYDVTRLLLYLMSTQTEIFDSIDAATLDGIKGHSFSIVRKQPDDSDDKEQALADTLEAS